MPSTAGLSAASPWNESGVSQPTLLGLFGGGGGGGEDFELFLAYGDPNTRNVFSSLMPVECFIKVS